MKITVFLPCRAGSERVPKKNTREFAGIAGGLLKIKLEQLLQCKEVDSIVLSTNDEQVMDIARSINNAKIVIDRRPEELASSATSTDDVIRYVPSIITEGAVLWTHVTSPFMDSAIYDEAIKLYKENLASGKFDSLMSVTPLKTFIWNKNSAINYDRNKEKWPRTQTIEPLFEINSGIFLTSVDVYKTLNDRIGNTPYLFETNDIDSFDIDWEEDFFIAEAIFKNKQK